MLSPRLFKQEINYKQLIETELTKKPNLQELTEKQFYTKFTSLLEISKSAATKEIVGYEKYEGFTALTVAVDRNLEVLAKNLIEQKADVNHVGPRKTTPIHCAAKNGNLELVELLYKEGASLTAKDDYEYAAIHFAAMSGNGSLVKWVLKNVGKKCLMEKAQYTNLPLHLACQKKNFESVEVILSAMDDKLINQRGVNSQTPFRLAVVSGNFEAVKAIKARLSPKDFEENINAYRLTSEAIKSGNVELFKQLLKWGARFEMTSQNINESFDDAIKSNNALMVQYFLSNYSSILINENKNSLTSSLIIAIENGGSLEILKLLLGHGADSFGSVSFEKISALEKAKLHGREDIVALFEGKPYEAKQDPNPEDLTVDPDESRHIDPGENYNPLAGVCCLM